MIKISAVATRKVWDVAGVPWLFWPDTFPSATKITTMEIS